MNNSYDYFNTSEYLNYLRQHCGIHNSEAEGRVAGSDLAIEMIRLLEILPHQRVLEIGCGVGRIMHAIRQAFEADVVGCDVSAGAINLIRQNDPALAESVYCRPSDHLDFAATSSIDHIVTWGVFELTQQRQTLLEMARVLKVGGRAMLGSVKNDRYWNDDEDSRAAHSAYISKSIPIYFTDIAQLENALAYIGLRVVRRAVFAYKKDVTSGIVDRVDRGGVSNFAEAVYVIEKVRETPLSFDVGVAPASREVR